MAKESEVLETELYRLISEKVGSTEGFSEYFSPGRINLIGEHVDYKGTGGLVVPAAVSLGITALARKTDEVNVLSLDFSALGWLKGRLAPPWQYDPSKGFINFVNGAYYVLETLGKRPGGFTMVVKSSIPTAAGMSSSAAFGVLVLKVLNDFYSLGFDGKSLALLAQRIENEFIGLNSGIMDQFAVANSRKNSFMVLNTSTLEHKFIKFPVDRYKFFVVNTAKSRELAASAYNNRVNELQNVASILRSKGIVFDQLADIADERLLDLISDNLLRRRFKHVITEVGRVKSVVSGIGEMPPEMMGRILNASHASLRDDYEVSCPEADFIHYKLSLNPKVYGSRIMGAGFGGCLIVMTARDTSVNDFSFASEYYDLFKLNPTIHEFETVDGTRRK